MKLVSPRFLDGHPMPKSFSGEGHDLSPPLEWSDTPERTRSFALICEDPDAPVHLSERDHAFVHWVVYGIPSTANGLPEGLPTRETIDGPVPARQGRNSFGSIGYGGPMPPVGHGPHHYVFTLYALAVELPLRPSATKAELVAAMRPHLLAEASLCGIYERAVNPRGLRSTGKTGLSPRSPDPESHPSP